MQKPIDIVPVPGMREDISAQLAEPGTIALAQNVRWRKGNRIEKRYGVDALLDALGAQPTDTHSAVGWLGSLGGTVLAGLVDLDGSGKYGVYQHGGTTGVGPWFKLGNQAVVKPLGKNAYARSESGSTGTAKRSVQVVGSYFYAAWDDGTNIHIVALNSEGVQVWAATPYAGVGTRLVYANSQLWLVSSTSTALEIRLVSLTGVTFSLSGATNIGTLSGAGAMFDAKAMDGGTTWLVSYLSAGTTLTTQLMTGSTVTTTRTTATGAGPSGVGIAGQAGENVYLGWYSSGLTMNADIFDASLTHVTGPFAVATPGGSFTTQVGWYRIDSTHFMFIGGGYVTSPDYATTYMYSIKSDATVGTVSNIWGWNLASKPFTFLGITYFWMQSDPYQGSAATATTSKHYALWDTSSQVHALITHARSNAFASAWLTECPALNDARGFSVVTTLRSQDSGGVSTLGLDLYRFTFSGAVNGSSNPYINSRQRFTAECNRALYISGGKLQGFDGEGGTQIDGNNFPHQPSISPAASAGAGLTADTTYSYIGVFEFVDALGQRHRSAPSTPKSVTPATTNLRVTTTYATLSGSGKGLHNAAAPSLHLYRSWGGGPYYRVTPASGAPLAVVAASAATATYIDSMTDAAAQAREILYTDGGVFDNNPPDGCAMMAMGADRMYVVGWDRRYVQVSRIIVQGEPVQFVNSAAFWIPLPEPATGLAYCDGSLLVFTASGVYVVYVDGAGPNDQGQGSFGTLRSLPSNYGCIDERSVCVTGIGVFYQSARGIMLVPRGFGAAIPVGDGVQDTMATYPVIAGAALVSDGQGERVHFLALSAEAASVSSENYRVLAYDLRLSAWSIDRHVSSSRLGCIGAIEGVFYYAIATASSGSSIRFLTSTATTEYSENFEQRIRLAPIRPNGPMGTGHFQNVGMVGEYIAECLLNMSLSLDGRTAQVGQFILASGGAFTLTAGDQLFRAVRPQYELGTALVISVYDSDYLGVRRGFALDSISLLYNPKPGFRGLNTVAPAGGYGLEQA